MRPLLAGLLVCAGVAHAQILAPFVGLNGGLTSQAQIGNHTVTSAAAGSQTATLTLLPSGVLRETTTVSGNVDSASEWLFPQNAAEAALYEAYATVTVGTLFSGTTGSWVSLGSSQSWSIQEVVPGVGPDTATFTLDIRLASSLQVVDTATITLTADRL